MPGALCASVLCEDSNLSGYPGGYCTVPVGTAAVPVL
jgi:hypothetical protein